MYERLGRTGSQVSFSPSLFAREAPIPAKKANKSSGSRNIPRSPDATRVGRELAVLALAWVKQDGHLRVRQREQFRRAVATAAEFLGWVTIAEDPVETATKDVVKLTKGGVQTIARELADEVTTKKAEISELQKSAKSLEKLAKEGDFTSPIEVSYSHTARRAAEDLVTKVQTLTLTAPQEATDAAAAIEKKLETWGKLKDQMLEELKKKQLQLEEMKSSVPDFASSSTGIVREVFATLH